MWMVSYLSQEGKGHSYHQRQRSQGQDGCINLIIYYLLPLTHTTLPCQFFVDSFLVCLKVIIKASCFGHFFESHIFVGLPYAHLYVIKFVFSSVNLWFHYGVGSGLSYSITQKDRGEITFHPLCVHYNILPLDILQCAFLSKLECDAADQLFIASSSEAFLLRPQGSAENHLPFP